MCLLNRGWWRKVYLFTITRRKTRTVAKRVYGSGLVDTGSMISNSKLKSSTSLLEFRKPTHILYFMSKDIQKVAAGFGFSVFAGKNKVYGGGVDIFSNDVHPVESWRNVATKSRVYAFGDNAHGQCGFDPETRPFLKPEEGSKCIVKVPSKAPVKQVHCTLDTSFILLESGELFSFGLGTDGQLGRNVPLRDWHCLPVEGDFKGSLVSSIKGSTDTLCAVTTSGNLFMWGQNEYEQMSPFSTQIQVSYPVEIRLSLGKILAADTTATSCVILNSKGEVFVWGFGVIGQGPDVHSLKRPVQLHPNLFSGGFGDDGEIQKIFAGNTSMFALSRKGNLFAWGINRFSHLGLGSDKDQYFPFQLFLPGSLSDLSVAPDHTLFLVN